MTGSEEQPPPEPAPEPSIAAAQPDPPPDDPGADAHAGEHVPAPLPIAANPLPSDVLASVDALERRATPQLDPPLPAQAPLGMVSEAREDPGADPNAGEHVPPASLPPVSSDVHGSVDAFERRAGPQPEPPPPAEGPAGTLPGGPEHSMAVGEQAAPPAPVPVMTWNVGRGKNPYQPWEEPGTQAGDLDEAAKVIAEGGAEVVALQEVYGKDLGGRDFNMEKELEKRTGADWEIAFGQAGNEKKAEVVPEHYNPLEGALGAYDAPRPFGNAVLARTDGQVQGLELVENAELPEASDEKRGRMVAKVTLRDGRSFTLLNSHVSTTEEGRQRQIPAVFERADGVDGPAVVAGDFNTGPSNVTPTAAGHDFEQADDGTPSACGNGQTRGADIDHVYVRGASASNPAVGECAPSDHAPVTVDISVPPPPPAAQPREAAVPGAGGAQEPRGDGDGPLPPHGGMDPQLWAQLPEEGRQAVRGEQQREEDERQAQERVDLERRAVELPPEEGQALLDVATPKHVALGDSYSAGTGTLGRDRPPCERTPDAYGPRVAAGRGYDLSHQACGGATTKDILEDVDGLGAENLAGAATGHAAAATDDLSKRQIDAVTPDTDVVTMSIGGNDAGFSNVLRECGQPFWLGDHCHERIDRARRVIEKDLPKRLDSVYSEIRRRAPEAEVVIVGYPRPFGSAGDANAATYFSPAERRRLNETADDLALKIGEQARAYGFEFVDPRMRSSGHEVGSDTEYVNGLSKNNNSFHPSEKGYDALAELVAEELED